MVFQFMLMSSLAIAVGGLVVDQEGYLNEECQQLLQECEGVSCLLLLANNPLCIEEHRRHQRKRAARTKIRQILVDSYLNRMG
ncbi:hypothetical protein Y032_0051g2113 [Ancylostoma ceylanicum]|uniref:Uncharacterized protein n=1 Tax=Ancylostoma ceylanicum TaxID=53326 RepID=A0A016U7H1_9BILA|nr:hypothetical protein Y032_0051g2113 [Ancylostoma ceylanicum]